MAGFIFSKAAERDISEIMRVSLRNFGRTAAARYKKLILQSIHALAKNPSRPEVRKHDRGVYIFHLRHCIKQSTVRGAGVRTPRHFIAYRIQPSGTLEIVRILYDAMDIDRHLSKA